MRVIRGGKDRPRKPRQRRRSPRALRFENVKVGDILIQANKTLVSKPHKVPPGMAKPTNDVEDDYEVRHYECLVVVTDRWFDPVYGQSDATAGQMVGVQYYRDRGPIGSKFGYTLRGLASNRYRYATPEEVAARDDEDERKARLSQAVHDGEVAVIRRR